MKQHCGGSIDSFVACAGLATYARPISLIPSVNYFGAIDLLDGVFELLKRGRDPAAVAILSNAALMMPPDESPYVQALLNHDEGGAWRILTEFEEADGLLLASGHAYMGSKFALGRALRQPISILKLKHRISRSISSLFSGSGLISLALGILRPRRTLPSV